MVRDEKALKERKAVREVTLLMCWRSRHTRLTGAPLGQIQVYTRTSLSNGLCVLPPPVQLAYACAFFPSILRPALDQLNLTVVLLCHLTATYTQTAEVASDSAVAVMGVDQ